MKEAILDHFFFQSFISYDWWTFSNI